MISSERGHERVARRTEAASRTALSIRDNSLLTAYANVGCLKAYLFYSKSLELFANNFDRDLSLPAHYVPAKRPEYFQVIDTRQCLGYN